MVARGRLAQDDAAFLALVGRVMETRGLMRISLARLASATGRPPRALRARVRQLCTVDCHLRAFPHPVHGLTVYDGRYVNSAIHVVLTRARLRRLREQRGLDRRADYLLDHVCPALLRRRPEFVSRIAYAWKASGEILARLGEPFAELMVGGESLGSDADRILDLKPVPLVRKLAAAFASVSEKRLRAAAAARFGPNLGGHWGQECWFDVRGALDGLAPLFRRAAALSLPVVFFGGPITR